MRILIVVATIQEIAPLLERLEHVAGNERKQLFKLNNTEIDLVVTGVGMIATAAETAYCLAAAKYDFIINAGICGAFNRTIAIGEVVNVVSECLPELGAENHDLFIPVFDLGIADRNAWPYSNGRMNLIGNEKSFASLRKCSGITVNTVSGSKKTIDQLKLIAGADVETMEGAGFVRAALMSAIPAFQIRAVSNYVEPRDRSKWNIPLAASQLNEKLYNELSRITQ